MTQSEKSDEIQTKKPEQRRNQTKQEYNQTKQQNNLNKRKRDNDGDNDSKPIKRNQKQNGWLDAISKLDSALKG